MSEQLMRGVFLIRTRQGFFYLEPDAFDGDLERLTGRSVFDDRCQVQVDPCDIVGEFKPDDCGGDDGSDWRDTWAHMFHATIFARPEYAEPYHRRGWLKTCDTCGDYFDKCLIECPCHGRPKIVNGAEVVHRAEVVNRMWSGGDC